MSRSWCAALGSRPRIPSRIAISKLFFFLPRIVTKGKILSSHIPYMRSSFLKICADRAVKVAEDKNIIGVEEGHLVVEGGETIDFDECLWCTQASASSWIKETGLETGKKWALT